MPQLDQLPISPAASPTPASAGLSEQTVTGQPGAAPSASQGEPGEVNPFNLPPDIAGSPAIKLVSIGAPPAVRVGAGEYYPELDVLVDNMDVILQAGLDVYKTSDSAMVLFNPIFISEQELQHLDQKGKLGEVVPDYGQVTGSQPQEIPDEQIASFVDRGDAMQAKLNDLGMSSVEEPVQQAQGTPTSVPPPTPQQQAAVVQNQGRALQAFGGEPTSGPRPGGGRLLNALLRPPPQ